MPFWIVSTNGDLNNHIEVPYIARKNGRNTHISKYEDYTPTNKYIEYEKNKDLLSAEIIIADIEEENNLLRISMKYLDFIYLKVVLLSLSYSQYCLSHFKVEKIRIILFVL